MKAIYNKPLTEIVTLNLQVMATYDEAHPSNNRKYADGNSTFFDEAANGNGNNTFFDD
jgi:hypothetical protein